MVYPHHSGQRFGGLGGGGVRAHPQGKGAQRGRRRGEIRGKQIYARRQTYRQSLLKRSFASKPRFISHSQKAKRDSLRVIRPYWISIQGYTGLKGVKLQGGGGGG